MSARVTVLLFAACRDEAGGVDRLELALAPGATAGEVAAELGRRFPRLAAHLPTVRLAVNQEYVESDHLLADGDEVALIPPVSGG